MILLIPYGTADRPRRQPLITYGLILFTAAAHIVALCAPGRLDDVILQWGYIPNLGAPLTFLASLFLHGGTMHLLVNLYMLYLAGPLIESRLGHGPFLLLYLAGGLASFAVTGGLSAGAARVMPHIGASGAIAAIIGAFVVLYPFADIRIWFFIWLFFFWFRIGTFRAMALFVFGFWFLIQALASVIELWVGQSISATDSLAHFGGFLFGALAAFVAFGREGLHRETSYYD